jgi:hypothetical protein
LADLAGAVFTGEIFAAGAFFTEADGALAGGFFAAVFFAAGGFEVVPEPAAAEDCVDGFFAARLLPGHSREAKTTATQYEVFLSSIRLRSSHLLTGECGGRHLPVLHPDIAHTLTLSCVAAFSRVTQPGEPLEVHLQFCSLVP